MAAQTRVGLGILKTPFLSPASTRLATRPHAFVLAGQDQFDQLQREISDGRRQETLSLE